MGRKGILLSTRSNRTDIKSIEGDDCKQDDITVPMFIDFRDYNLVIDYFEEM